jgi:autotransporter-associated beta strand protein
LVLLYLSLINSPCSQRNALLFRHKGQSPMNHRKPSTMSSKQSRLKKFRRTLLLESLEDRNLLATWTGVTSTAWNVNTNWDTSVIPAAGEDIIINTGTPNSPTLDSARVIGALSGNGALDLSTFTLTTGNATDSIFSGTIAGSGSLTKTGIGTLTLSNNNSGLTGAVSISAGAIKVTVDGALGTVAGSTVVSSGASLILSNVNYSTLEPLTLNGLGVGGNGALQAMNGTSTFSGPITTLNASTNFAQGKTATQSTNFDVPNTYPASRALNGNTADFTHTQGTPGTYEWLDVNLGSSVPLGNIELFNRGGGCCQFRLTDFWVFVSNNPFGAGDNPTTLANRGDTSIYRNTVEAPTSPAPLTLNLGDITGQYIRVQQNYRNILSLGELRAYTGTTAAVSIGTATSGDTLNLGAITTSTNGTYTRFTGAGNVNVTGAVSGAGSLNQVGTGTLTLSGANTHSGATQVTNGVLKLGAANVVPDGAGKGNVVVRGGKFDLNGFSETINGLNGLGGTVDNSLAASVATLTLGSNNAGSYFGGAISDTGAGATLNISKTGANIWTPELRRSLLVWSKLVKEVLLVSLVQELFPTIRFCYFLEIQL